MTATEPIRDEQVAERSRPTEPTSDAVEASPKPDGFMADLRRLVSDDMRQGGIFVAFVVIVVLFSLLNENFLSPGNLTNIILQFSYILILAIGMSLVIIGGHIDLSVGSVVALTGASAAVVVIRWDQPWFVGVLAALGVGLLVGVWQGFWVAYVEIPRSS